MGKTSLLEFVADYARLQELAVHTLRGMESEAVLPFAAITDLLWPLRSHLEGLPAVQREALEVCLALSAGSPTGPLAACAGALGVLTSAAEQRPLIILVDDFQWLDAESAQILQFVARRVVDERLAMVFTVRAEPDLPLPDTGLPMLSLTGLSATDCAELAAAMGVAVGPRELASLVESTGGNPLAVAERLRTASAGGRDGDPWDRPLINLHHSLERTWGRLFDRLPDDTRIAMFIVAADHDTGGRHTVAALKSLGLSLTSLSPAERLGLVARRSDGIRLRHPLLRSVVIARAPVADRAAGYHALAEAADGYSRSWYLAAAALGPDEQVASALVAAADDARQRNGLWASARTLHRAAELTGNPGLRAERLLQAAQNAHLAGDSSSAAAWCEQALCYRNDPSFAVDVQRIAGGAFTWLGQPRRALELMTGAAAAARLHFPMAAAEILAEATGPAIMQGDIHLVRELAEQVEAIWEYSSDAAAAATPTALAMVAEAFSISGNIDRAALHLRRVSELPPSSNATAELHGAAFHAQGLGWSERYSEARYQLTILLNAARRLGSPTILAFALAISAEIGWWAGQWTTAYADATEALQWATENGQPGLLAYGLSMLSRLEGARGERELCQSRIYRAQREVEPRGVGCAPVYGYSLGLAALGGGELYEAADRLQLAWDLASRQGINNPNVFPIAGDLAEALARAGESDRCIEVVNWLDERAEATQLAYPRAAACRARGILALEPEDAQRSFNSSLDALEKVGPVPFEHARTLLCSGEALRRARRPADARVPLNRALGTFEGLGARPWAARARAELAASGVKHRRVTMAAGTSPNGLSELSPQELQVARIAARGQSNVEVAAALFVSRKTVEAHLTRVYRKLGIRSRTELARTLLANGIVD
jgi:DNA-binding CsgD family transcriptional regulator